MNQYEQNISSIQNGKETFLKDILSKFTNCSNLDNSAVNYERVYFLFYFLIIFSKNEKNSLSNYLSENFSVEFIKFFNNKYTNKYDDEIKIEKIEKTKVILQSAFSNYKLSQKTTENGDSHSPNNLKENFSNFEIIPEFTIKKNNPKIESFLQNDLIKISLLDSKSIFKESKFKHIDNIIDNPLYENLNDELTGNEIWKTNFYDEFYPEDNEKNCLENLFSFYSG